MAHANSLRVIGQSLEVAKLRVFQLETDGPNYVVRSNLLTKTGEWILRHALALKVFEQGSESTTIRSISFSPIDISRLDEHAQKQRRLTSPDRAEHSRLSGLLHTLGDHLDRTEARAFSISWTYDSVFVDYQLPDGQSDSRTFTTEKLEQIGSLSRFAGSGRTRFAPRWFGPVKGN